jgi:hypothetical protein
VGVRAGQSLVPDHFPVQAFELERMEPGLGSRVQDLGLRAEV